MNEKNTEHIEAVKRLLEEEQNAGVSALSDDETAFLAELKEWIDEGRITVDFDSQRYFDLVSNRYPTAASRIAWPAIRDHKRLDVRSEFRAGSVHCDDLAKAMANKRDIIHQWFRDSGVMDDAGVNVVGDVYDAALKMTLATLLECYPALFVQPQHTYALPMDGAWCLMGTVEGQIYFGNASDAVATGPVELEAFLNPPSSSEERD